MLAQRLEELIEALGIRKKEFAGAVGFSQAYISMILRGNRPHPSDRFFQSVSRAYPVDAHWLRTGEGEMFALPAADLSQADLTLLKKYRLLKLGEQKVVDEVVDAMLLKSRAADNPQGEVKPIP